MKELDDGPYEKCLLAGPEALSDSELLAVILRTGTGGVTACELAEDILSIPGYQGLTGLCRIPAEKLMTLRGVGKVKAVQLKCLSELSARIAKAGAAKRLSFDNPSTIADYFMEELRHREQECLYILLLNTRNALLGEKLLFKGTVNASLVSPREIFLEALQVHAVSLVLVHNHPGGDPSPSEEDIRVTGRIRECGALLDIKLLDHIIIGDRRYCSLKELGIIK